MDASYVYNTAIYVIYTKLNGLDQADATTSSVKAWD